MGSNKTDFQVALEQIENVIKFKKCWKCGCNQGAIKGLEKEVHKISTGDQKLIEPLIEKAKSTFQPIEYDCLGCKICFPGDLANALTKAYSNLELEPDSCATEDISVEARTGFPPFPGNYQVFRYHAPVAVCTLNSKDLMSNLTKTQHQAVNIVGTLNTENLGIERVIRNTISNPNIRYLILCGEDSEQRIGHLPGQSLLSLFQNGVGPDNKIIGAQGKRPLLKNLTSDEVKHFREQIEVVDLIGNSNGDEILGRAVACQNENKGEFEKIISINRIDPIAAQSPSPLVLDPKGYFIVFPDVAQRKIVVEHYLNAGVLNRIIEGNDVGSIYMTIIDLGLLSKLDHAAYLGKELARAEVSLETGAPYVQDQAQDVPQTKAKKKNCGGSECC